MTISSAAGVEVRGPRLARYDEVLTGPALEFVARLHREFNPARQRLLAARRERQARLDAGELPDFPSDTRQVREGDWTVASIRNPDLQKRWVELTVREVIDEGEESLGAANPAPRDGEAIYLGELPPIPR